MLLLSCVILPAAYSPARAQKPRDIKKAQELYEKALQKKSVAERIHLLEQAAQLFAEDQSSTFSPESARQLANIHSALGREFCQQARWQAAITHLEKALALDSGLLPARATLGLAYFQQGRYDAAIEAYDLVLRAQPYGRSHSAQLYNNLGAAHEAKGDLAAAVAAYSRALELEPRLVLAQKNLQRAQDKLSRLAASAAPAKSATTDSVQLATRPLDSLAATTAKPSKGNSKTTTAKDNKGEVARKSAKPSAVASPSGRTANTRQNDKKNETKAVLSGRKSSSSSPPLSQATKKSPTASSASSPRSSQQSALPAQRPSKTTALKKEAPTAARSSKPALLKDSARDSAAAQIKSASSPTALQSSEAPISRSPQPPVALNPSPPVTEKTNSLETSRPRSSMPSASSGSVVPVVFGISALLLAVLVVMQRRRLGHVWLQVKPAFAASTAVVSRQVRLLPSRLRGESFGASRIKLLSGPTNGASSEMPLEAESPEPTPVSRKEPDEPRHPSLQTQAFFAEMIAAEPEIEEFDEAALPANGHIDHASAEPSLAEISNDDASLRFPLEPIDPAAGIDNHNGALQADFGNGAITSKPDLAIDSIDKQALLGDQLPVTSNQLSVISYQQAVASSQQPATNNKQTETSNQLPVISNQQPATSDQSKRSEDPASAGHQALGRYLIQRKIGKGAMGDIYLALDPKLDRRVVIKTVCFNLAASDTDTLALKDRVYREARAIAKLGHPNIVVVYDVEDDKDMSYIVMEHIEGRDLRQALTSEHRFDYPRAIKIVSQVCSALDYAHQAGIIHRDVKPSNIMLLPGDKAKVTDFGIAKIADNFSLTLPGHVLGTPSYMAPEQFEGEEIDGRADIFSLGVVLYELLTSCRPFTGDSLASLAYKIVHKMHIPPSLQNVELPLELDEIVGRALAKNPKERYATAMEFREALLALPMEAAHGEIELAH
jgi:tetratricopeptide (TPR) repeat protein/tRNA A-37 threonylcarbamoyl transferase component Bud32